MTNECCKSCAAWDECDEEFLDGLCRRHAPRLSGQAVPHGNSIHQVPERGMWPKTGCDDWCWEFIQRRLA